MTYPFVLCRRECPSFEGKGIAVIREVGETIVTGEIHETPVRNERTNPCPTESNRRGLFSVKDQLAREGNRSTVRRCITSK